MNSQPTPMEIDDLLLCHATEGLEPADMFRLRDHSPRHGWSADVEGYELAAAALDVALIGGRVEPLPDVLRERLVRSRSKHVADRPHGPAARALRLGAAAGVDAKAAARPSAPRRRRRFAILSGSLAAAAVIAFAAALWWTSAGPREAPVQVQRAELLREATDVIQLRWQSPKPDAFGVIEGDVVWSSSRQQGFMRLNGVPVNDPAKAQYQLWIVDPSRDDEPVDGGVFNVPDSPQPVTIPIDAKLAVADPRAFAITLEKPGGVVVSSQPIRWVAPAP